MEEENKIIEYELPRFVKLVDDILNEIKSELKNKEDKIK